LENNSFKLISAYAKLKGDRLEAMRRGSDEIQFKKNYFLNDLGGAFAFLYLWYSFRKLLLNIAFQIKASRNKVTLQ
jgi:hypothetical protein